MLKSSKKNNKKNKKNIGIYIIPFFFNSMYVIDSFLYGGNLSLWRQKLIDMGLKMAVYSVLLMAEKCTGGRWEFILFF